MAIIGSFTSDGNGYTGNIRTLTITAEARFVRAEDSTGGNRTPDFRIFAGTNAMEIGAAWTKQARDTGRTYLSVKLDDPCFAAPIFASLHKADDGTFNLVWSR
jgi:uncharacterized protein (DUF736 family)